MKKLTFILSVLVFLESTARGAWIENHWVISREGRDNLFLGSQERTRPILVGDIVFSANLEGRIVALERTNGNKLWEKKLPEGAGVEGAFTYGRSKLIVGDTKGNLYALRARDGEIDWKFSVKSQWLSPPVIFRDKVFAVTSGDEVYALNEKDGTERWHYGRKGDEKMTIRGAPVPTLYGNELYIGFSDGNLVALTADHGKILWNQRLKSRDRFYDIDMAPHVDKDGVIAASFDGNLYSLNRTTGDIQWVLRVGSYGGFLVEDNHVYFSGLNGNFYSVSRSTGNVEWKRAFSEGVGVTPTRVGDFLVVPTSSDPIYALDPKNGEIRVTENLGTGSLAAVTAHPDGWFYCLSNYGNLFAFELHKESPLRREPEILFGPSALTRFARLAPNKLIP